MYFESLLIPKYVTEVVVGQAELAHSVTMFIWWCAGEQKGT